MPHYKIPACDYIRKEIELTQAQSKLISAMDSCNYVLVSSRPRAVGRTRLITEYIKWEFIHTTVPTSFIYSGPVDQHNFILQREFGSLLNRFGYSTHRNNIENDINRCYLEVTHIDNKYLRPLSQGFVPDDVLAFDNNANVNVLFDHIALSQPWIGRPVNQNFKFSKQYTGSRYIVVCDNPDQIADGLLNRFNFIDPDQIAIINSADFNGSNFYEGHQFNKIYDKIMVNSNFHISSKKLSPLFLTNMGP